MTVVLVTWILVLMALFGVHQTRDVTVEARAVARGIEEQRVRASARSGIELARHVLANTSAAARPLLTRPEPGDPLAGVHRCGDARFAVGVLRDDAWFATWRDGLADEGARLPVANADVTALTSLPGFEDVDAETVLDAVASAAPARVAPWSALDLRAVARARAETTLSRFATSVNVNTAPEMVLRAAGVPRRAAEEFVAWRAGSDGREGTSDDRTLGRIEDWIESGHDARPDGDAAATISYLQATGRLSTVSDHFRIRVRGWIPGGRAVCEVEAVLETADDGLPRVVQLTEHWSREG